MLARLLIGLVKGLLVGSLLGLGLVKLGEPVLDSSVVAYLAAAVTGILTGLVAGKPIWAKDAKIEAGTKAAVGAVLGLGLMVAVRHWLFAMPIPLQLGSLAPEHATIGGFAMTALAAIAGVLGGFYEADNDAPPEEAEARSGSSQKAGGPKRIAASHAELEEEEELESEPDQKRTKK